MAMEQDYVRLAAAGDASEAPALQSMTSGAAQPSTGDHFLQAEELTRLVDIPRSVDVRCCCGMVQPGLLCCFCCPLLTGVRMVALYTMMFCFGQACSFRLLPMQEVTAQLAMAVCCAQYSQLALSAWGMVAGMRGLLGVRIGDAVLVKGLFWFYVASVLVEIPSAVVYELAICDILKSWQQLLKQQAAEPKHYLRRTDHLAMEQAHRSCPQAQLGIAQDTALRVLIHICFAYAAWSLSVYLSAGTLVGEDTLALERLRAPLVQNATSDAAGDGLARSGPGDRPRGNVRAAAKFQAFQGTAHRLE
eukprot:TRINITY_DN65135_c0_g1_i1.p1 TRINITY_DN65135_c0_g1~~TRINITY_DN65135_c0_g1_i1.p1  ORF type:complete len:304 (+),score=23.98 TRINITY_DN65135_c0_g1_i1:53-964(+)